MPARSGRDGWPTQAWFWLEWGSSTARQSSSAALSRFRAIRVGLDPYLTAGCAVAKTAPLAVFEALTCPPPAQRTELRTTPLKPNSGLSGPPVLFQDVVHSIGTREADCDEQYSFRGQIEWTSTRMPDSLCAVERLWSKP